jgi:SAM-dependent methyltransferase
MNAKDYWENKILGWENARYSAWTAFSPLAWSVRSRLHHAADTLHARCPKEWKILDLGCGSGVLAQHLEGFAHYTGIDIAANAIDRANKQFSARHGFQFYLRDIRSGDFPVCDVAVFLGVTDWLSPTEIKNVVARLKTKKLLFSFTDAARVGRQNPYRWYRNWKDEPTQFFARSYRDEDIRRWMLDAGYRLEILSPSNWRNPGVLAWGSK